MDYWHLSAKLPTTEAILAHNCGFHDADYAVTPDRLAIDLTLVDLGENPPGNTLIVAGQPDIYPNRIPFMFGKKMTARLMLPISFSASRR